MSRDFCVALPQDATDLSAVCDCGIYCSYSLTIFVSKKVAHLCKLLFGVGCVCGGGGSHGL